MELRVYRRADDALVVVPSLFQSPLALSKHSALRQIGVATVELAHLGESLVADIGIHGYAIATGADEALIRMCVDRATAAGAVPGVAHEAPMPSFSADEP
ncbi:hypothetical protein [Aerolutibacter ruishenii]|uniref:hypothetical protein n=1 Tax=Aerolutibacter ruishenii TaxID=686800 RepID=UPI0011A3EFDF|nr:hypothetical protein [Lysobacter ruishenii]